MAEVKWIKLMTGLFGNGKIKQIDVDDELIERDTILIIWIKLLCLAGSVNEGGDLMLTSRIAYTDKTLAREFGRPLEVVRLALEIFQDYEMITLSDGVYQVTNWEKYQNTLSMEKIREDTRKRVAKHREKQKEKQKENSLLEDGKKGGNVTVTLRNATEEEEEEEEEEENIYKGQKRVKIDVSCFLEAVKPVMLDYLEHRKEIKRPATQRAVNMIYGKLSKESEDVQIKMINRSIENGWVGIFPLPEARKEKVSNVGNFKQRNYTQEQLDKLSNRGLG